MKKHIKLIMLLILFMTIFFKIYVDAVEKGDSLPDVKFLTMSGEEFAKKSKNREIQKAQKIKPLRLLTFNNLNGEGNAYFPSEKRINFSININVYKMIKDDSNIGNNIPLDQRQFFNNEITEARIKGSIMHELSHWLNDAFHNNNVSVSSKKDLIGKNKGVNRSHQFLTDYELDAQVHAIIQYRKKNRIVWNKMTLTEALENMPFYFALKTKVTDSEMKEWKRYMYTRLSRENLLGKKMKKARNLSESSSDSFINYLTNL